eukprot:gene19624-biopygen16362
MAVGTKRSAPAFAKLGWPTWGRRRAAARAAFVAKVHEEGEPPSLKELLPPPLADGQEGMLPSVARRGELVEPAPRTAAGEQAFSVWAPRVVNQIINDNVFEDCSSDEEQQHSSIKGGGDGSAAPDRSVAPSDEFAAQRKTYYAELIEKAHFPMSAPAGGAGTAGWGQHPAFRTPQPLSWFSPPVPPAAVRGGGGGPAPAPIPPHNRLHWERDVEVPRLLASIKAQSGVFSTPDFQLSEPEAMQWREQCPHGPHQLHGAVGGGRAAPGGAPPPPSPRPPAAAGAAPPYPPYPHRAKAFPVAPPHPAAALHALRAGPGAVHHFSPPPPPPPAGHQGTYQYSVPSIGGPPPFAPPPAGTPPPQAGLGMSPPSPAAAHGLPSNMEEQLGYVAGSWHASGSPDAPPGAVIRIAMAQRPSTAYNWSTVGGSAGTGSGELGFAVDGTILRDGKRLAEVYVNIRDKIKVLRWEDKV